MNKTISIALLVGAVAAFGTTAAVSVFADPSLEPLTADPIISQHVLEITEFYQFQNIRSDGDSTSQYPVIELTEKGSFARMEQTFETTTLNQDGHFIIGTCDAASDHFNIAVRAPSRPLYFTAADYAANRPIALQGFSKLTRVQFYMDKDQNEVACNGSKYNRNFSFNETSTETETIYTISCNAGIATYVTDLYYYMADGFKGKRFVLNKIVLTYDC